MYSDASTTGLAHKAPKKAAPAPPQPSASVKKLHSGGYVVTKPKLASTCRIIWSRTPTKAKLTRTTTATN